MAASRERPIDDSLVALTRATVQSSGSARPAPAAARGGGKAGAKGPTHPLAHSFKGGGNRLHGQAQRYLSALRWVAQDALPRYRSRVALIVLFNFMAIAAATGAVGGVMLFARHAELGQPIHFLRWTIQFAKDTGSNLTNLWLCGAAIALLGVLSAVCQYITDNLILSTAKRYHHFCAERAMAIVHDPLCRGWQLLGDEDEHEAPRNLASRMIGGATKQTTLALRDMLRILLPALTFIAAVTFLVWIDLRVTVVVLPIAMLYLLPLYLINRQVTRKQKAYRAMGREARGEVSRALRARMIGAGAVANEYRVNEHGRPNPPPGPVPQRRVEAPSRGSPLQGESYRGALSAFYGRLLADRRTHMLNTAFFVACLVALLMFFGVQAREHGRPWSDLILYLVALRFAMTALRQVTTLLAKFSRFFPEYRAYGAFGRGAAESRQRRAPVRERGASGNGGLAALPEALTVRVGKRGLWDSPRGVKVDRNGATLWVLMPLAADYVDLEALAARLERIDEPVDLATNAMFIARAVDIDDDATAIAAAPMIVLADDVLQRRAVQATLAQARGFVAIVSNRPDAALLTITERNMPASVIVMDGSEVLGGGDAAWLKANAQAIAAELARRADELQQRGALGESEDEEDEDEDAE